MASNRFDDSLRRVRDLTTMLLEGGLSDAESQELANLLRGDAALQKWYVDHLILHGILELVHVKPLESEPGAPVAACPSCGVQSDAELPLLGEYRKESSSSQNLTLFGAFEDWLAQGASFLGKPAIFSILVAICLPAVLLAVLLTAIRSQHGVMEGGAIAKRAAEVAQVHQCVWEEGGEALPVGGPLFPGQRLQLRRGLVKLTFANGADVILQGPGTLVVDDAGACSLEDGKLSAYVPSQAKGFRVHSGRVTVIDLGTEFGMQVGGKSDTEVYVFDGVVEASVADELGSAPRSETSSEPRRLERDTALRVTQFAATVLKTPIDPEQFVRRMPGSGVTDRPVVRNGSFEYPPIDSSPDAKDYFKVEYGNTWNMPLAGWQNMIRPGLIVQPSGYQVSPYKSPVGPSHDNGPAATDGRQVAWLELRKAQTGQGLDHETIHENWLFQSLGRVVQNDVGRIVELKADVAAREGQHDKLGDAAKAIVSFATHVTTDSPGTVVGNAGVLQEVLCADGVQTLTATLTVSDELVGEQLFVRLWIAKDDPRTINEQYHFDNVRCQTIK